MNFKAVFDWFVSILISISGAGAIMLFLTKWFGKILANKLLEDDRQKYRKEIEELKNLYKRELEEKKNELNILATEHKIKYSKLHEERAKVIKKIYYNLVKLEDAMFNYITPIQYKGTDLNELEIKAADAYNIHIAYFSTNEIFLQDEIAKLINGINTEYKTIWQDHHFSQEFTTEPREMIELRKRVWEKIKKEIPKLKEQLKKSLQEVIGLE